MYRSIDTPWFHWRWKEFGSGPNLLLAFQGFNRSPDEYQNFENLLGNKYTILSFELFFHGESVVRTDKTSHFTLREFKDVISEILALYKGQHYEVIAYSFGGRLAMNCVEVLGEKIKGIYLMAPDALRFNPAFWFATQTSVGRNLFLKFEQEPGRLITILNLLSKSGIRDKKAMDFFINQVRDEQIRKRVVRMWNAHSKSVPDIITVAKTINKYKIRTLLFFGINDTIIKAETGKRLLSLIDENAEMILLDVGHRLPEKHQEIAEYILKA